MWKKYLQNMHVTINSLFTFSIFPSRKYVFRIILGDSFSEHQIAIFWIKPDQQQSEKNKKIHN